MSIFVSVSNRTNANQRFIKFKSEKVSFEYVSKTVFLFSCFIPASCLLFRFPMLEVQLL